MKGRHALVMLVVCALQMGASACSSGGGTAFIPNGDGDGDGADDAGANVFGEALDARAGRDGSRKDGASTEEEDDAGLPALKDGGKADGGAPNDDASPSDASSSDATVDVVATDECFDTSLGHARAIVKPSVGDVLISEWMPDPTAVTDANGEWLELRTTASFDLNALELGTTSLAPVVTDATCVPVTGGDTVLLAHGTNGSVNGLGSATVDAVMSLFIVNANGTLKIGTGGNVLHSVSWSTSTPGKSVMIDASGKQCTAPASVAAYNASDMGTPGAINSASCP